jgi:branched-subunit amino acid ABC-type transport system permease component
VGALVGVDVLVNVAVGSSVSVGLVVFVGCASCVAFCEKRLQDVSSRVTASANRIVSFFIFLLFLKFKDLSKRMTE